MTLERNDKPEELIDPSQYLGRDLRDLPAEEFQRVFDQYQQYSYQGFTDQTLGENLGQQIAALETTRNLASQGEEGFEDDLQIPWIFTDED